MKNKNVLLGLVLTVITTLSFAKGPHQEFQVEVFDAQAFSMQIDKATQDIEVYFLDRAGSILFESDVRTGASFGKTFDMQDLPDGKYQLKVVDAFMIQVLAVELKHGKVEIDLDQSRYYDIPEITQTAATSTVRMNSISMDPRRMVLDNHTGRLLYSGKVEGHQYAFNLPQVSDQSKLVINSEGLITMEGVALSEH